MRFLLSTVGSRGDVQPLVALAMELRALEQDVRICVPPDFQNWIEGLGFPVVPIGPELRKAMATAPPAPPATIGRTPATAGRCHRHHPVRDPRGRRSGLRPHRCGLTTGHTGNHAAPIATAIPMRARPVSTGMSGRSRRTSHVTPQLADQPIERPVKPPGVDVEDAGDLANGERLPESQRHEPPLFGFELVERLAEREPRPPAFTARSRASMGSGNSRATSCRTSSGTATCRRRRGRRSAISRRTCSGGASGARDATWIASSTVSPSRLRKRSSRTACGPSRRAAADGRHLP